MEGSTKRTDAQKQVGSEISQGEESTKRADEQKQVGSEISQGEGSTKRTDAQKQVGSEISQGEESTKRTDALKQVGSERSQGEIEGSTKRTDALKQVVFEISQEEMEGSTKRTDAQKQVGSERSQGELEGSTKRTDAQKQVCSERSQGLESTKRTDALKQVGSEISQGDFEELEKMVKHLEEEKKNLTKKLIQREQVMGVVTSNYDQKLTAEKKCLELKEESWKMERDNFEKRLSDLTKSVELKEESWMKERNILKEQFEQQLESQKLSMKLNEESWKMKLKDLEEHLEKQISEQKQMEESWKEEERKHREQFDKLLNENNTNLEKILAYQRLYSMDNLITGSPLERFPGLLPLWMTKAVAPKGYISGDEFGVLTANLISMTALMVTLANKDTEVMFPLGFMTLCGTVVGTMFNNIVTSISVDPNAKFTLKNAWNQIPWVLVGAGVPLLTGGFIPDWRIRCAATSAATLVVQVASVATLKASYGIKLGKAACIVGLGVLGISLAAGLPQLIAMIGKIGNK